METTTETERTIAMDRASFQLSNTFFFHLFAMNFLPAVNKSLYAIFSSPKVMANILLC